MEIPEKDRSIFVLDTNVLLYDHNCVDHFEEHDVVIPITVLEELDDFKKGSDLINFQAREFIRKLDRLAGDRLLSRGIPLGQGRGRLFVRIGTRDPGLLGQVFMQNKADHRILAVATELKDECPDRRVLLITKDINLRMKARSIGIEAEDYETGKVRDIDSLYTGSSVMDGVDTDLIGRFYEQPFAVPVEDSPIPHERLEANKYFILRNGSNSALAYFNPEEGALERVMKVRAYGISPRNAEQTFALHALLDGDIQLVTLTGKAGTGKTLLALAAALAQRKDYRQIYLARPVVPLGNRDLGYLPGDVQSKLDPYMQPLYDNLGVIQNRFPQQSAEHLRITEMLETEKLFIAPLAYIRGRSLDRIFFIVDEAQNLTPHEVKTIITRAGEGTKIVFTGDIYQIDTPYLDSKSNGLTYLVDKMKGQELYAHVNLLKGERSTLAELASNIL
jgi:PhoH-like ATPase